MKRFLVGAALGFVGYEIYREYNKKVERLKVEELNELSAQKELLQMHNKLKENWDVLKNYIPPKEH